MRRVAFRSFSVLLVVAVISLGWVSGSEARHRHHPTIHVTTTDDATSTCLVKAYCSLRSAITMAQPGTKIVIPGGFFQLSNGLGSLAINEKLTLQGAGASATQIVGNTIGQSTFMHPVFTFGPAAAATLKGLTVSGGNATGFGGGIQNTVGGTVNLISDVISNNVASSEGGGIANEGTSTINISKTLVTANEAPSGAGIENSGSGVLNMALSNVSGNFDTSTTGAGGGIVEDATAFITKSTIANNSAGLTSTGGGGGIFENNASAQLTITRSTISGNQAANGGGVYINLGNAQIVDSTVAQNDATSGTGGGLEVVAGTNTILRDTVAKNDARVEGGGIQASGGTTFLQASIFGENTVLGTRTPLGLDPDCWSIGATLVSHDFNVIQDVTVDCHLTPGPHDSFSVGDPNLGGLAFNGGPTETMAIPKNASLAVRRDAHDPLCNGHLHDQRGKKRAKHRCDSGAFQVTK